MHPLLFEIPVFGGIKIYTYGVLVAGGFLAGMIWIRYEARRLGLDSSAALDLVFYIIVSAIIGSRIMYLLITEPGRIISEPWSVFAVWEGGLVFFGGLIAALITSVIFIWKKRLAFWSYADVFAPAIAIGHAVGRIGCLMAGCCYGSPAVAGWFSVTFPDTPFAFAPVGIPLYPTQMIEALGDIIIFFILVVLRRYKKFDGQIFALYLMLYSILRFANEYLRGDPNRGCMVPGLLTTAQGVSILIFACGAVIIFWRWRREGL